MVSLLYAKCYLLECMNFIKKFFHISQKNNSLLCVGLDIDKNNMPKFLFNKTKHPFFQFNKSIIDATKDLVCAYKLNMAFYEVLGKNGVELLEKTIQYMPKDIIVILDGKRNDIGHSAQKYAQTCFETYHADATTVNPYLGFDGIGPFLNYSEKCSFILCRTSNASAKDFQDLQLSSHPLYQIIAQKIKNWSKIGTCGAVVGATYPDELKIIRGIVGEEIPILIPGIGKQGGDVKKTIYFGTNSKGDNAIINSSRGIIFAGKNESYAESSRKAAKSLRDEINKYR